MEKRECDLCGDRRWLYFLPNQEGIRGACCPLCNADGKLPNQDVGEFN